MRRASPETDQICRSLLQKCVRRGNWELAKKTIALILEKGDLKWLRSRLAVMTFEECWPYGEFVSFANDEDEIIKHYYNITTAVKFKDAAGLGSLAYVLSEGGNSVLSDDKEENYALKTIKSGIERHRDFWPWIHNQQVSEQRNKIIENSDEGFRKSGWPWDRAFAQSSAYLAYTLEEIPKYERSTSRCLDVPLWTGIDKHTKEGKVAIRSAAKKHKINANHALWFAFYFESAKCNDDVPSKWWDKEVKWRMSQFGYSCSRAEEIWGNIKFDVANNLKKEVDILGDRLEKVKPINCPIPKQESLFKYANNYWKSDIPGRKHVQCEGIENIPCLSIQGF